MSEPVYAVNLYPCPFHHAEASISGTREGLEHLRGLIECALENGVGASAEFYCSDGEGHDLRVFVLSESDMEKTEPCYTSYMDMS